MALKSYRKPCLKELWYHVLISLKIIPWGSKMRSKTCTSIIFKYPFLFTFPTWIILHTILKEMSRKWLKRFIIMCQMTQCTTHFWCNMLSCCTSVIWGSKVIPQKFILFGMMDATNSSSLQELGTLLFSTHLWQILMTCQMVVKWFGIFFCNTPQQRE